MNLTQKLFTKLPEPRQLAIANDLLKYDLLHRLPLFKMFFRSLVAFGADRSEMIEALAGAKNLNGSFYAALSGKGTELLAFARDAEANGKLVTAKDAYLRSTLYHLVADWPLQHADPLKRKNYNKAMECFEHFKRFHLPAITKVDIPFRKGTIKANIRFPEKSVVAAAGTGSVVPGSAVEQVPAVIIFQGNDSVKEFMVLIEDYALERGLATLTVDQPGFGESGMTGNFLNSSRAAHSCIRNSIDFLTEHPLVNEKAIGAFGFSFGGFTALYSAGLSKRVRAVSTIGAPMRLQEVFTDLSFLMKQRTYQWSGCSNQEEVLRMLRNMKIEQVFGKVNCPAYIIHGQDDEVVDKSEALAILDVLKGDSRLDLMDDGDHTCSLLLDTLLPEVFDWFADQLA